MIVRGINRTVIFRDAVDGESFLSRLGRLLTESATPWLAWALMSNHAHLCCEPDMSRSQPSCAAC